MKHEAENQIAAQEDSIAVGASADHSGQSGKIGWALAWLIGVPLPLLLVIYLFSRAC
ncbi:MAG TPA: hypothetical protein VK698_23085 [Kofleriaceae bacterium]|nr:hypothetical protein [Kofleriaceae bacterium]